MIYKNIILSAGALSCFAHVGIYRYLYEKKLLNNLENVIGTSGGSIAALIFVLQPSYLDIKKMIYLLLKYSKLKEEFNINLTNLYDLMYNFGLVNSNFLYKITNIIFKYHKINPNITFAELYNKYPINLMITGSNLTKQKPEIFSYKYTPHMTIKKALSISCSIPVLCKPVIYNNNLYNDGGIFNYFPYNVIINEDSIKKNPNIVNETLAISIILHDFKINSIKQYILYLLFLVSNNNIYNNQHYKKYDNIIYYYEKLNLFDYLNFDISLYYKFIDIIDKSYQYTIDKYEQY